MPEGLAIPQEEVSSVLTSIGNSSEAIGGLGQYSDLTEGLRAGLLISSESSKSRKNSSKSEAFEELSSL